MGISLLAEKSVFHRGVFLSFLILSIFSGHSAVAQDVAGTSQPVDVNAVVRGQETQAPQVVGFRSARFGMDEAAVRQAIIADFGIEDAAISVGENVAERTRILSVAVPDVLEGGGTALVSYVMGYQNAVLDQVSVLWSPQTDETIDGAKLVANGRVLQSYFLGNGYAADGVVVDATVDEGVVMFRGLDAEGRMALLLLRGSAAAAESGDGQVQFVSSGLMLAYLANPANPDVFTVKQGQF